MSFPESIAISRADVTHDYSTAANLPLGTRGYTPDGRVFRWAKNGATTIAVGYMVQAEAPAVLISDGESSQINIPAGTTVGTTWGYIPINSTRIGDATAITKDNYKEGWIWVSGTGHPTGVGQMFQIATHDGHTASSTEYMKFYFEEGVYPDQTFTTDVGIGIAKNIYDDVIAVVTGAEPTTIVLGISPCAVAANYYFWVQTWGTCVAYLGAATTARAVLTGTTDAAVTGLAVPDSGDGLTLNTPVGQALHVVTAGGYSVIQLQCSP